MNNHRALILGIALSLVGGSLASAQTVEPLSPPDRHVQIIADVSTTPPSAPSNLQAHVVSNTQITLTWQDNSNDETEFDVQARTASGTYTTLTPAVPANSTGANILGLQPGTTYFFRVFAHNASGNSGFSNEVSATTLAGAAGCTESATAMCLNGGRFRVEATFLTPQGQFGQAHTVKLTDDSGYLWFFSATNIEAVVKVLNACTPFNRYWVFAGGLTNVHVTLTVTDTLTGDMVTYNNPQNRAFQPIQDTQAFATCP